MPPQSRHPLDKNVSPNWKSPAGLANRKPGMTWSDRLWHLLVCLGGVGITACGAAMMVFLHLGHLGSWLVGLGFVVFLLGFPTQAQRNGYRE